MVDGFRIQAVAIEGFKGFTKRQVIDFQGRHAFLLGKNHHGKSSILEAVRWGLFGSTGSRGENVANRDYSGQCRVEITLQRDGKHLNHRRTLLRGVTGGTDAVLTDEQGIELSIRDNLPQLDSVDAGEGMHIIFAPQAGSLHRQPEDLSAFERTVFRHLGLTHPRSMLSQMDKLLDDQRLAEVSLGKDFDDIREKVDKDIAYWERQRGIILTAPPWDGNHAPSVAETENKVRRLITEIMGKAPDQSLAGVSLDALIDSTEKAFEGRSSEDHTTLEKELAGISEGKDRLLRLQQALEAIVTQETAIQETHSRLQGVLGGVPLGELRQSTEAAREAADAGTLRLRMVQEAISLLHRDQVDRVSCPICEVEHDRHDLESALQRTVRQLSDGRKASPSDLEPRLKEAEDLVHELQGFNTQLAELKGSASDARTPIDADNGAKLSEQVSADDLQSIIEQQGEREASIQSQIDNQKEWVETTQARLSKLREEEKFHQMQKELVGLGQSRSQLNRVEAAYQDLVSFGETIEAIRDGIATCLKERLEEEIPPLSERLSQVFAALTHHPWYDRLTIPRDTLPKLELRVTSSSDPSSLGHSPEVLNGQAQSALALVPYFVFSQDDDAPTEVLVVLLDDPTRSYDEDHIDILVERLADLGHHVQLMVASHEIDRFRALLPKYFERANYLIVKPARWSHDAGPELSVE